ncbi:hypothetical protein ACLOJK_029868 [Asimina triloba]
MRTDRWIFQTARCPKSSKNANFLLFYFAAIPKHRPSLSSFSQKTPQWEQSSNVGIPLPVTKATYVAEDRLKDFFSQKGEITDAKIMRTVDGKSRQFAFIGFRTEREADEAITFFNNSYLDTCRITCEVARKVGDPNIPRPWSRHSRKKDSLAVDSKNGADIKVSGLPSSKGMKILDDKSKDSKQSSMNDDLKLQEFLVVMQPRSKSKVWANDTVVPPLIPNDKMVEKESKVKKQKDKQSSQSSHVANDKVPPGNATTLLQDGLSEAVAAKPLQEPARDEVISDMDYFKSRIAKEWSESESDHGNSDSDTADGNSDSETDDDNLPDESNNDEDGDEGDMENAHAAHAGDEQKNKEQDEVDMEDAHAVHSSDEHANNEEQSPEDPDAGIHDSENPPMTFETGRLFIRNLPYTANEDDLMELFSKFGDVSEVHIVVDKETKRSKGIGYVLYTLPESAVRFNIAVDEVPKTLKQQREEQRKVSEASGDSRAWNSLFMRPDTVVENIARKYGISKSELLDREADDLAVRMALGETHVVGETKKALANAGVNVDALEDIASGKTDNIKRSNHEILVKNLPYGSSEGDLAKIFGQFGSLDKIILPPTKTLALVIFLEASEARAAFKGLAYKRYKDAPLYLEWAPNNILNPSSKIKIATLKDVVGEKDVKRVLLEQRVEGISEEDIDPDRVEDLDFKLGKSVCIVISIFVKNLNFKTTEECLQKHFSENMKDGKIQCVKIKKHLKNGKNVSMGFGFIELDSLETAANVCKDLQGTVLEGHALILQLCHAKKEEGALKKVDKDNSLTKLIVRNVAFEATQKELRQLFSPFGQIKSLRLPMKFGGHRGFAFVEYVTKQEAQNAMQALSSTHLYGRHLVLEQAKEKESLEELRARTAAQFTDEQSGYQNMSKLSKKRKHLAIVDQGNLPQATTAWDGVRGALITRTRLNGRAVEHLA